MAAAAVAPLERFPVDLDLSDEFLKTADSVTKETPENRAQKIQELIRLINETCEIAPKEGTNLIPERWKVSDMFGSYLHRETSQPLLAKLNWFRMFFFLDTPDLMTRTDDVFLLRFLRAKYFHVNYAFQLLKNYEEFKLKNPEWQNVNLNMLEQLTNVGAVQVLPSRDQHGRRIFYLQAGQWKPTNCPAEYLLQTGGICGDATIVEPMTQVAGIVMVFDLKDVGMTQLKGISPSFAKRMVHFLASCVPVRINAIHIVNEPAIFSMFFTIFKAFLTERMKKRIHFHGSNMSSLHEHVTAKCLPPCLGGTFGEVNPNEWFKVLSSDMVMKELKALGYKFNQT